MLGHRPQRARRTRELEAGVDLQNTGTGTLVALRQLYPNKESRDEMITKYGAARRGQKEVSDETGGLGQGALVAG